MTKKNHTSQLGLSRLLLCLLALLVWLPIAVSAQQSVGVSTITGITPSSGSVQGGSILTILGTNFDAVATSNTIFIGNEQQGSLCTVIPLRSSTTHLECQTQPPRGATGISTRALDVTVVASGYAATCKLSAGCKFSFLYDNTPLVDSVTPEWIDTQESPITANGGQLSRSDTNPTHFDVEFRLGDALCDTADFPFNWGSITCQTGSLAGGVHDISLKVGNGAAAEYPTQTYFGTGMNRAPPQVVVVPNVTRIAPLSGSMGGGQLLTIFGFGFDQNAVKNIVLIPTGVGAERALCPVERVSSRYIVCRTPKGAPFAPVGAPVAPTSDELATPVLAELWYTGTSNMPLSQFRGSLVALRPQRTRFVSLFGSSLRASSDTSNHVTRYTAMFVPPETGNFTFYAAADDFADLLLDDQFLLWECSYSTTCMAENVTLVQGVPVKLSSAFKNNNGPSWLSVTVGCPSGAVYSPIPSTMLQRVPQPPPVEQQIQLSVNGVDASCAARKNCPVYSYDALATPYVTMITPDVNVAAGDDITVTGLNFPMKGATVKIGKSNCIVTSSLETQIRCRMQGGVVGRQRVQVRFTGLGDAIGELFVEGTPRIASVIPQSISNYGGTTLTVLGSGFGDDASLLEVRTAGVLCSPILSVEDNRLTCTTGALSQTSGSLNVTIAVINATVVELPAAFPLPQDPVIAGWTNTTERVAWMSRSMASSLGGDDLSIRLAKNLQGYGAGGGAIVTFLPLNNETSQRNVTCKVYLELLNRIHCITPPTAPGEYRVVVTTSDGSSLEQVGLITVTDLVRSVRSASGWSPYGGNYFTLALEIASPRLSEIDISVEGTRCNDVTVSLDNAGVIQATCFADRAWASWTPNPAEFRSGRSVMRYVASEEVPPSTLFDVSAGVAQYGSQLYIDSKQRLMTKQKFSSPMRVRARFVPTVAYNALQQAASCVRLRAMVPDLTSETYGVEAYLNDANGNLGVRYNGWAAVNTAQSAFNSTYLRNVGYDFTRPVELVLDIRGVETLFFVDGVLVAAYERTVFAEGHVGFTSNCQGILLDSLEVEDMSALGVAVTHQGKRLPYASLAQYNVGPASIGNLVRIVSRPIYYPNNVLQIMTSGDRNGVWYALKSPSTPFNSRTLAFCRNAENWYVQATNQYINNCTIDSELVAGEYRLVLGNYYGFSHRFEDAYVIAVVPRILGYIVAPLPSSAGAYVVLQGASLPALSPQNLTIRLGSFDCDIMKMTATRVSCRIVGSIAENTTLSVLYNNQPLFLPPAMRETIVPTVSTPVVSSAYMDDATGQTLQINGANFTGNARVILSQVECVVFYVSSTNIRCFVSSLSWDASSSVLAAEVLMPNGRLMVNVQTVRNNEPRILPRVDLGNSSATLRFPIPRLPLPSQNVLPVASFFFNDSNADTRWGATRRVSSCASPNTAIPMLTTLRNPSDNYMGILEKRVNVSEAAEWGATALTLQGEMVLVNNARDIRIVVGSTPITFTRTDMYCPDEPLCAYSSRDCVLSFTVTVPFTSANSNEWSIRIEALQQFGVRWLSLSANKQTLSSFVETSVDGTTDPVPLSVLWVSHSAVLFQVSPIATNVSNAVVRVLASSWNISQPITVNFVPASATPPVTRVAPLTPPAAGSLTWLPRGEPRLQVGRDGRLGTPNLNSFGWNSAITSLNVFPEGTFQSVTFTFSGPLGGVMFGLSSSVDSTADYSSVDAGLYRSESADGYIRVYESGSYTASASGWNVGARLTISCFGKEERCDGVQYWMEGDLLYTSYRPLRGPLHLVASFHRGDTFVEDIQLVTRSSLLNSLQSFAVVGTPSVIRNEQLYIAERLCSVTHVFNDAVICATAGAPLSLTEAASVTIRSLSTGRQSTWSVPVSPVLISVISSSGSVAGGQQQQYFGALLSQVTFPNCSNALVVSEQQVDCFTAPASAVPTTGSFPIRAVTSTGLSAFTTPMSYSYSMSRTPILFANVTIPSTVSASQRLRLNGTNFLKGSALVVNGGTLDGQIFCASELSPSTLTTTSYFECTVSRHLVAGNYNVSVFSPPFGRSVESRSVVLTATLDSARSFLQVGTLGNAAFVVSGANLAAGWSVRRGSDVICILASSAEIGVFSCPISNATAQASSLSSGTYAVCDENGVQQLSLPSAAIDVSLSPTVLDFVPRSGVVLGTVARVLARHVVGHSVVFVGSSKCAPLVPVNPMAVAGSEQWYTCTVSSQVPEGSVDLSVMSEVSGVGTVSLVAAPMSNARHMGLVSAAKPISSNFAVSLVDFARTDGGDITLWLALSGLQATVQQQDVTVTVKSQTCLITQFSLDMILCTFAVPSRFNVNNVDVTIKVKRGGSASVTLDAAVFTTITTLPIVVSMTPASGPAIGGTIVTFTGSNFDPNPQMTEVYIGGARCMTQTVSADLDQITCATSPMPANHSSIVTVSVRGVGEVENRFVFDAILSITNGSTSAGVLQQVSVEGGALLTIMGLGFSASAQTAVDVGFVACVVKQTTNTFVVCQLPASPRPLALPRRQQPSGSVSPQLQQEYSAHPEGTYNVVLRMNGVVAAGNLSVTYATAATPVVERVEPLQVTASSVLTITGSGFADSGNLVTVSSVGIAPAVASTCVVVSESSTSITCRLNAKSAGSLSVVVTSPTVGKALHRRSCPSGQYLMCDGSCLTDQQCSVASWGRFGSCASIVELISGDTFCDSNGGTDLAGTVLRMDGGQIFNMNCPLYSCEGNDCNTTVSHGDRSQRVSTCGSDPNMLTVQMSPLITSVTPALINATTNGGLRLAIQGQGLFMRSVVMLGGVARCTPLEANSTYLLCEVGAMTQQLVNATLTVTTDQVQAICLATCSGYNFTFATPRFQTRTIAYANPAPILTLDTLDTPLVQFVAGLSDLFVTVGGRACVLLDVESPLDPLRTNFSCSVSPHLSAARASYPISVRIANIGYAALNTSTVPIAARIFSLAPNVTSLNGGAVVTILGSGFNAAMTVATSCGMEILNITGTSIIARSKSCGAGTYPATVQFEQVNYNTCIDGPCTLRYQSISTPTITSAQVTGLDVVLKGNFVIDTSAISVRVGTLGSCTVSFSNSSLVQCTLPERLLGGAHPLTVLVPPLGYTAVNSNWNATYPLSIGSVAPSAGSIYGGQLVTITGSGFGNSHSLLNVSIGGVRCAALQVVNDSVVVCTTPPAAGGAAGTVNVSIVTTLGAQTTMLSGYTYSNTDVPRVSSVSPARGSTAGGTMLTILGLGLNSVTQVFTGSAGNLVLCAQTPLDASRSTATEYYCTTAAHATMLMTSLVTVYGPSGYGDVQSQATFQHIDLWSRITTWGNTYLPLADDSVAIGEGQIVMLDMSPPKLYLIVILSGQLIFDTTVDITLECTYIVVNFGRLAIGNSMADPFTKKATIRLWGDRLTPEIPAFGSKVIFMRQGRLDIHGKPRQPTWTRLNGTASAGDIGIVVRGPIDWQVGEEIGISSTDFEPLHYERRHIVRVESTEDGTNNFYLELDAPLEYEHYGVRQCFDALQEVCIDEIAEVMLMTRNVEIVGDPDTPLTTFGAQVFVMPGGYTEQNYARITYTEIHQSGQRFLLGRYSVHFHVARDVASSYIIGNSVHDTYNRAFTIHGTNNNTYTDNVVCNTEGHSFFFEDGSEHYNVLRRNLVMGTRASTSLLNSDLSPASFWITNPLNYLYDNVAAGSEHYGFWISPFIPNSVGPTASVNICPYLEPLGAFVGQVSHSHGNYGLNIKPEWIPKSVNCNSDSMDRQAYIENMTIYKTQIHGINFQTSFGAIEIRGLRIADIGTTDPEASFIWTETQVPSPLNHSTGVSDSVFIAFTNNQPYRRTARRRGINMPLHDNWFNRNITWVNFVDENWAAEPFLRQQRMKLNYPWGWTYLFKQMRYINSPNRVLLRFEHHAVLFDEDGSLGNVEPGSYIVPQNLLFDPVMCPAIPAIRSGWPLRACKPSYPIRRLGIGNAADLTFDQLFTIEGRTERVYKLNKGYLVTIPVNRTVGILFDSYSTPQRFWWNWNFRYIRPNERALFEVKHLEERLNCSATFDSSWSLPVVAAPLVNDSTSRDYFDRTTWVHSVLHARPQGEMVLSCVNCPDYGCPTEQVPTIVDKECAPFGLASSWSSGVVPLSGADVNVTFNDSICLDRSISTFPDIHVGLLTVSGSLLFTDKMCPSNGSTVRIYIHRFLHIHGGRLRIGNDTHPIVSCRVEIIITDVDHFNSADVASKTLQPWGSRAFVLQHGELYMFGRPTVSMQRLSVSVNPGDVTLSLDGPVNWRVGDQLGLARTRRDIMWEATWPDDSTEVVEISAISADNRTLTLRRGVRFAHDGRIPQVFGNRTFNVGAEVVLLTRSIVIRGPSDNPNALPAYRQGWQLSLGCSAANYEGCIGKDYMSPLKPGVVQLSAVSMWHVGQSGKLHGSIEVDGWVQTSGTTSFLRNLSLWSPLNSAVMLRHTSAAMEVADCVFFNVSGGDGVRAISANNRILRNIVVAQGPSIPFCSGTYSIQDNCRVGAFRIARQNIVIGNIAASSVGAGFVTDGESCSDSFRWYDNVAHSARDGVLVYDAPGPVWINWPSVTSLCRTVGGILTYANSDAGMSLWYVQSGVKVVNFSSVDNMMGLVPVLYDPRVDDGETELFFSVQDSLFAGTWNGQACRDQAYVCRHSEFNNEFWCKNFMAKGTVMGSVGLIEAVFLSSSYTDRTLGEEKFFWSEPDSYHTVRGKASVARVWFDNFVGTNLCGTKSVAFFQQIYSNDTFHQHTFSNITWGPGMQTGGELWTKTTYGNVIDLFTHAVPNPVPTVFLNFDDPRYGGFWPDSPNKLWLVDLDGSFTRTGVLTNVLSSQTLTRLSTWNTTGWNGFQPTDAIGAVRPECSRKEGWNAFTCTSALSFVSLVIESTASDALDRRVAPLVLCKGDGMMDRYGNPNCPGGIIDFASGPYMKGKPHRMILSRMSRWRFVAENLGNYTLMFRGSPPTSFRIRLLDYEHLAIPASQVGLVLNVRIYGNNAQMRQSVFVDGVKQFYTFGFDYPYVNGQTWPAPLDAPGTHYLDKYVVQGFQRNVLYLTVRPNTRLDVAAENVVSISMSLSMTLSQFYNQKNTFVLALANVIGVEPGRLRFVNVVAGTTRRRADGLDLQVEVDSGNTTTPMTAETASTLTAQVQNISTETISQVFNGSTVSSFSAQAVIVVETENPIAMQDGTPYVLINATTALSVNTGDIQRSIAAYIAAQSTQDPLNGTTEVNVIIGNLFTKKNATSAINQTRFTVSMAYPLDSNRYDSFDVVRILDTLSQQSPLSNQSQNILPAGYTLTNMMIRYNGATQRPPPPPPPSSPPPPSPPPTEPNVTTPSNQQANNGGGANQKVLSQGAVIGIAVGSAAVLLIGGIILFVVAASKQQVVVAAATKSAAAVAPPTHPMFGEGDPAAAAEMKQHELPPNDVVSESPSRKYREDTNSIEVKSVD